ncbi:RICIN domain-containing protein [Streptomyces sp. NPDC015661]|uniref:RICIN domain-containing protein n=1 Tax=Streptomyces sp. NPDC015661 TaxID=3364961 RepID=UPI0036F65A11
MARYDDLYVMETTAEPRPSEQPSTTRQQNGEDAPGRTIHRYGRLNIVSDVDHAASTAVPKASDFEDARNGLKDVEKLGLAALRLRQSEGFIAAKADRPRAGERWDMPGCTTVVPTPTAATHPGAASFAPPTSAYLEGSVAVGIIIVQGPTAALQFTDDERTKVVAEVQNGLGWLAAANPLAGVSFSYDIQTVSLSTQPDPSATDLEAVWRDPAMGALGYSADWNGVLSYVEAIRSRLGTRWTYCGFFTKYPVGHFAYASIGGPRVVMDYNNDGWGPDNIDRVFAHESGHIFGCPDEYAASGCDCGGRWGRFGVNNGNCASCASGGGSACLMKQNDFSFCDYTASHLGWSVVTPLFARHSGKALDVSGISPDNGAPVIQWDYWGGNNQRWRLEAVGDGYVRAVAQHSGKVLDVSGISPDNGAPLIQWDWWGGDNQRWRFDTIADGVHVLIAKHSGKALDVEGISKDNGARLIQWDYWGGDNQRWQFQFQPLFAKHSGRAMDVSGIDTTSGAAVIQWDYWGGDNQNWRLEPVGDGYVRIIAKHSGKVLDVEGASTDNGARLIQWDWWGGDNQRFRVEPVEDGYFKLTAKHSGKVVDVSGISLDNGAQLIQWDWWGGDNQRWRL